MLRGINHVDHSCIYFEKIVCVYCNYLIYICSCDEKNVIYWLIFPSLAERYLLYNLEVSISKFGSFNLKMIFLIPMINFLSRNLYCNIIKMLLKTGVKVFQFYCEIGSAITMVFTFALLFWSQIDFQFNQNLLLYVHIKLKYVHIHEYNIFIKSYGMFSN